MYRLINFETLTVLGYSFSDPKFFDLLIYRLQLSRRIPLETLRFSPY